MPEEQQHDRNFDDLSFREMVIDLLGLSKTILTSAQKNQEAMENMRVTIAVVDTRLKSLEKIIWPLVIACLSGLIAAVIALIQKI